MPKIIVGYIGPQSVMVFSMLKTRMLQTIDTFDLCLLLIPSLEEHGQLLVINLLKALIKSSNDELLNVRTMKTHKVLVVDLMMISHKASTSTGVIGTAYDNSCIPGPGFPTKRAVGFKPMLGIFNQFKYIPLKACPLVLELELVSNLTGCIVESGVSGDFAN